MSKSKVDQAREALSGPTGDRTPSEPCFLSTGVTLINLANYGRVDGGIAKGHIYRIAGRSSSGKTFLCRTILAEAARSPAFADYDLIYDDVERGALMDTEKFFGRTLVNRLVPPARSKDRTPLYSNTTLEFYRNIRSRIEKGVKLIWILDSLDSLSPDAESKMGDGKAKINSQELRKLLLPLEETGSILVLISQVRANMNIMPGPFKFTAPEDVISGGRAPEFYSTLDMILRKSKSIKTVYKERNYVVGHHVTAKITKNRLQGREEVISFPFYPSYGIDDIGANVDWLVLVNYWAREKGGVEAKEFDVCLTRNKLVRHIEDQGLERSLQNIVGKVWGEIRDAITMERKPRYE